MTERDDANRAPGAPRRSSWIAPDSGPAVARLIHALLGLVFVVAFVSLLVQLGPLFGSDGLSPMADAAARARGSGWWATPTLLWWWCSDAALVTFAALGAIAGMLAMLGLWPRVWLGIASALYLSFVGVGEPFLGFQWDSLLIEAGVLATLLPRDRPSPVAHALLLFALFKVYFESGLAKAWSPAGDWWDGSAMSYYYETAPLPTPLAWYAHHLPGWWHVLESRATLVLELVAPLLMFCGRRGRLAALAGLTAFQVVNLLTANYGFFVYLTLVLHLLLLRDADLMQLYARVPGRAWWGRVLVPPEVVPAVRWPRLRGALLGGFAAVYLGLSLIVARVDLGGAGNRTESTLRRYTAPLSVFNVYHLFQQITRVRIEPEFAARVGEAWVTYDLNYKPGPLGRAPPVVAPHQPRLDFQLWFYGLRARRAPPGYVRRLLERLCRAPADVQRLFAVPLRSRPSHVRVQFWRYTFTAPGAADWWQREPAAPELVVNCPKEQVE